MSTAAAQAIDHPQGDLQDCYKAMALQEAMAMEDGVTATTMTKGQAEEGT